MYNVSSRAPARIFDNTELERFLKLLKPGTLGNEREMGRRPKFLGNSKA
jgi:hypothetical protein